MPRAPITPIRGEGKPTRTRTRATTTTRSARAPSDGEQGTKPAKMPTQREVAEALTATHGMITTAARMLGMHVKTLRSYVYRFPIVSEALKDAREATGDLCETRLYDAIERGESWAIKLYATTQMRDRGYGEKPLPVDTSAQKVETPKSLSIDYDAYNRAYEEAMNVVATRESPDPD